MRPLWRSAARGGEEERRPRGAAGGVGGPKGADAAPASRTVAGTDIAFDAGGAAAMMRGPPLGPQWRNR